LQSAVSVNGLVPLGKDPLKQGYDMNPAWSPTGDSFVFESKRNGQTDIYAFDTLGGEIKRLTEGEGHSREPAWSPDNQEIAFISDRGGNYDIYTMKPDGSQIIQITHLTNGNAERPTWLSDSQAIVFSVEYKADDYSLYSVGLDGFGLALISSGADNPTFSLWPR
jgi:TolB protein